MDTSHPYYIEAKNILANNPSIQLKPNYLSFREHEEHAKACIGNNLKKARKSTHLSQDRMARALGLSVSQYKKYESATDTIRIDISQKWSLLFCLPVFHLLEHSFYEKNLQPTGYENELNFLWYLANSLTDEYFEKLLRILSSFTDTPNHEISVPSSGISAKLLTEAVNEIENNAYICIAYGLRALRHHFNITQEMMAELIEVSTTTYQEYEKPIQAPRFNMLVAARFVITTGIDPLVILAGLKFSKVRKMQNTRMDLIKTVINNIDPLLFSQIRPLIDGFASSTRGIPQAKFRAY